jgi:hypothetical protein
MFHSFLFDDAELQFKTAANVDDGCAVAYWAEAIGLRWASDERVQCGGQPALGRLIGDALCLAHPDDARHRIHDRAAAASIINGSAWRMPYM